MSLCKLRHQWRVLMVPALHTQCHTIVGEFDMDFVQIATYKEGTHGAIHAHSWSLSCMRLACISHCTSFYWVLGIWLRVGETTILFTSTSIHCLLHSVSKRAILVQLKREREEATVRQKAFFLHENIIWKTNIVKSKRRWFNIFIWAQLTI